MQGQYTLLLHDGPDDYVRLATALLWDAELRGYFDLGGCMGAHAADPPRRITVYGPDMGGCGCTFVRRLTEYDEGGDPSFIEYRVATPDDPLTVIAIDQGSRLVFYVGN